MPAKKHVGSSIGDSPLLINRSNNGESTINPGKLDQARFTEIQDMEKENSPIRIIIYVIIVIIVGVGAALLVKKLISNGTPSSQSTSSVSTSSSSSSLGNSLFAINTTPADESNATNVAKNTEYTNVAQTNLGDSTSSTVTLNNMTYTMYNSFARIGFQFTTTDSKLPKANVAFDSTTNKLEVAFPGLLTIPTELKQTFNLNDINTDDPISQVMYTATTNDFILVGSSSYKYRVFTVGSNLYIDLKTSQNVSGTSSSTTSTASSSSVSQNTSTSSVAVVGNTGAPAAPFYTNTYSQNKQFISSSLTTNSVEDNIYYFDIYGADNYEFSLGQKGATGDASIPNAIAYYDTTSTPGKIYLMLQVSNLSKEIFSTNSVTGRSAQEIKTVTGADAPNVNFNRIDLISFQNGVANYRLELKKQTNFKLWVDKTSDGSNTLSLSIKNN